MAIFHARGLHHGVLVDLGGHRFVNDQIPQHGYQLLRGDAAGPQQPGPAFRQIHDGGLHPHPTRAAIHHGGNLSVVIVEHMLGSGGGGLAGNIGGGRGNGHPGQADDFSRHGVVRAPQGHGGKPTGGALRHILPGRQHHGQGAGPEGRRQSISRLWDIVAELLHLAGIPDVQNQRIILRPALGLKNLRHGGFVQAVGSQTVNGLRGNRHQLPLTNQRSSDRWRLIV